MRVQRSILVAVLLTLSACSVRTNVAPGVIPEPPPFDDSERVRSLAALNEYTSALKLEPSSDPKQLDRVNQVAARVLTAAGFQPGRVQVSVVQSGGRANAVAIGGAALTVYDGLLEKVSSDEELAVVMSHEVGHLLGQHSDEASEKDRTQDVSIASSILGTVASVGLSLAGVPGGSSVGRVVSRTSAHVGMGAYVKAYDRSQEYEADRIGLMVMARAGYDPRVALAFWGRADEIFGEGTTTQGSFYSTHPNGEDRLEELNEVLPLALREYELVRANEPSAPAVEPKVVKKKNRKSNK